MGSKMIHVRNNNNTSRHLSLIESLDYGMPYPLWTYHYLLQLIREKYIIFMDTFLSNFQYDNPCTFHFYAHVVDAPTHPAPSIVK